MEDDACTVPVPLKMWEDILYSIEYDVSWGYKNELLARIRQHFDGFEGTD